MSWTPRRRCREYEDTHELEPNTPGLPYQIEATRIVMGYIDGRYIPASFSGPEEWPEWVETDTIWSMQGVYLTVDDTALVLEGEMDPALRAACLAWLTTWGDAHPYEPEGDA